MANDRSKLEYLAEIIDHVVKYWGAQAQGVLRAACCTTQERLLLLLYRCTPTSKNSIKTDGCKKRKNKGKKSVKTVKLETGTELSDENNYRRKVNF